jgi:hypothetical protein
MAETRSRLKRSAVCRWRAVSSPGSAGISSTSPPASDRRTCGTTCGTRAATRAGAGDTCCTRAATSARPSKGRSPAFPPPSLPLAPGRSGGNPRSAHWAQSRRGSRWLGRHGSLFSKAAVDSVERATGRWWRPAAPRRPGARVQYSKQWQAAAEGMVLRHARAYLCEALRGAWVRLVPDYHGPPRADQLIHNAISDSA